MSFVSAQIEDLQRRTKEQRMKLTEQKEAQSDAFAVPGRDGGKQKICIRVGCVRAVTEVRQAGRVWYGTPPEKKNRKRG